MQSSIGLQASAVFSNTQWKVGLDPRGDICMLALTGIPEAPDWLFFQGVVLASEVLPDMDMGNSTLFLPCPLFSAS